MTTQCPVPNLADPDTFVDGVPYDFFKKCRAEQPVFWQDDPETGVGFWTITRQADLDFVSKNTHIFSSAERTALFTEMPDEDVEMQRLQLINMDPPNHLKYRRVVNKAFTPRGIATLEPMIRTAARQIVDGIASKGECEFVSEVAAELPLQVICELMDVDQRDRHRIYDLTNTMIGSSDPDFSKGPNEALRAAEEIYVYAMKLLADNKANPKDNIVCRLIDASIDGECLSDDEFCQFFLLLLVAGNETTRTVTSHGMNLLIQHPDQLQLLVDKPDLIPQAVEEFLRYEPAVINFRRTAMQDVELGGQQIHKGDKVVIWYSSANRDEAVYENAERFDVTREPAPHRSFGIGEHFCLGSHLARLELCAIFEEIIPRLRHPVLQGPIKRLRSNFINGVKEMRIAFDSEQAA